MDYDTLLILGIALIAWGVLIPFALWMRVQNLEKRKNYLEIELKNILKTLKESETYKTEKEKLFKDTKSYNSPSIFPVPKQRI